MQAELRLGYGDTEEIRALFSEYTQMLLENDPTFAAYLALQGYEDEIADVEKKYGLPDGRLYIAAIDGQTAGCIALRKLDDTTCEMKRLYVRPGFRGQRLASQLVEKIIAEAKAIGYQTMLLDTLPFLESAIRLYRLYGFTDTECYNDSPMENTVYLRLDL